MSKKKPDVTKQKPGKTKLPEKDAQVELTEDELNKVSGGFVFQNITWGARTGARIDTKLGIRAGLTGIKMDLDS